METVLGLLSEVAPAIVKTFVPGGPLIDLGIRALSKVFGLPETTTEQELAKRIKSASPEDLAKIRAADKQFKIDMEKAGIDLEKVHAGDRASARDLQKTTRSIAPGMIASVSFLGFFGILAVMIFHTIPKDSIQPVMLLLGVLGTIVVQVANFYFGSSKSSADKNAILANGHSK